MRQQQGMEPTSSSQPPAVRSQSARHQSMGTASGRDERTIALTKLYEMYERLAGAAIEAGRSRGWFGSDPHEALRVLATPDAATGQMAAAAADLWLAFFSCFRPDEQGFEAQAFRAQADELNRRLAGVPAGQRADSQLTTDLLRSLEQFWHQRHAAISQRLDQLIADLSHHQAQIGSAQLSAAHTQDEISRIQHLLTGLIQAEGLASPANETPVERLARVLAHYRGVADRFEQTARENARGFGQFLQAVRAVATRGEVPPLPPEAQAVLDLVRSLDHARREQEQLLRELKGTIISLEGQRRELEDELERRKRRVTTLEHDDTAVDQRLELYREAFAIFDGGGDPRQVLEKVRVLERVVTLDPSDETGLLKALDRSHADLVRDLSELFALQPLVEDPRKYRPRGFLGLGGKSAYDLKSLGGLVEAIRDGARDLRQWAERARWAQGVQILSGDVPKIRAVFHELIKLVAHWREKLGDPPPVSISISLDGSSGVLALPTVVATDIEVMLRRKTKVGPAAQQLAPIMDECVALYHAVLCKARGATIPRHQPESKRESAIQQLARLTAELAELAGTCDAVFGEAAQQGFELDPADRSLLAEERHLRGALAALDHAANDLLGHRGVPPPPGADPARTVTAFPAVPGKRDIDGIREAATLRVAWWDLLARYRFVVG